MFDALFGVLQHFSRLGPRRVAVGALFFRQQVSASLGAFFEITHALDVPARGRGESLPRRGAQVRSFALLPEQHEQFDGMFGGAAEPVRGPGVELGGLARAHQHVRFA